MLVADYSRADPHQLGRSEYAYAEKVSLTGERSVFSFPSFANKQRFYGIEPI